MDEPKLFPILANASHGAYPLKLLLDFPEAFST